MRIAHTGFTASACLLALALVADAAHCQVQRYQPSTPTVSPYLNLTRTNLSGLPNYYSLVRPQLNQRAFNQQQLQTQARQAQTLDQLRADVQGSLTPTGKNAGFMTLGQSGAFLDTTRYYPSPPAIRRR